MGMRPVSDLAAFLAARWDEEEAAARAVRPDQDYADSEHQERWSPARVLREVAAKRAILAEHHILTQDDRNEAYEEFSVVKIGGANRDHGCVNCHYYGMGGVKGYGICRTVRHLAAPFASHPDYDPAWAAGTASAPG